MNATFEERKPGRKGGNAMPKKGKAFNVLFGIRRGGQGKPSVSNRFLKPFNQGWDANQQETLPAHLKTSNLAIHSQTLVKFAKRNTKICEIKKTPGANPITLKRQKKNRNAQEEPHLGNLIWELWFRVTRITYWSPFSYISKKEKLSSFPNFCVLGNVNLAGTPRSGNQWGGTAHEQMSPIGIADASRRSGTIYRPTAGSGAGRNIRQLG